MTLALALALGMITWLAIAWACWRIDRWLFNRAAISRRLGI